MDDRDVNPHHAPISGSRFVLDGDRSADETIMLRRDVTAEHPTVKAPTVRKLMAEHFDEHQPRPGDPSERQDNAVRLFVSQSLAALHGLSLSVDQGGESVTLRITGRP